MGFRVDTEKRLVWDNLHKKMLPKTAVNVVIVTNKGTVIAESGEVFCENASEIFEASQVLKNAMSKKLGMLE